MDKARKKSILMLAMRAGEIMMESGAEISRVEDTIERICTACGIDDVEVFAMPTGIIISLDNDSLEESVTTYARRAGKSETDLQKISKVNEFSREFITTDLSVEEGMQRLEAIAKEKRYHFGIRLPAAGVVAACCSAMFGGSAVDSCCAFLSGLVCYTLSRFLEKYDINFFMRGMFCCGAATFFALVLACLVPEAAYQPIISGTIMLFVPGVAITNSIRDFLSGDMLSGLIRMAEAVFTAVAVAGGVGIVMKIWSVIGGAAL